MILLPQSGIKFGMDTDSSFDIRLNGGYSVRINEPKHITNFIYILLVGICACGIKYDWN